MTRTRIAPFCFVFGLAFSAASACEPDRPVQYPNNSPPPGYAPPYAQGPGYAPPPGYAPGPAPAPQPGYPPPPSYPPAPSTSPTPAPAAPNYPPPAPPAPQPGPQVTSDPINNIDMAFLHGRAQAILANLIQALPDPKRSRVASIPLLFDNNLAEVNAFASCSKDKAAMVITAGILDIEANLAQAAATDEVFGTQKLGEYISLVASKLKADQPPPRPAPGFYTPAQALDSRKLARQHQLLDEQIAFVLGHELGHHYLGHLPCTAQGMAVTAAELSHILSSQVPVFNQPNEYAADVAGTVNVLDAGARMSGYRWTEGGGLLTMKFFAGLSGGGDIFDFARSHPPSELRVPVIQTTANSLRMGIRPFF
ncbi:MAG: M48 family metalloprotease [Polyangiaceae bacterium]|nr:M48 family metalloprotease [Polyangiaceae bacterium]